MSCLHYSQQITLNATLFSPDFVVVPRFPGRAFIKDTSDKFNVNAVSIETALKLFDLVRGSLYHHQALSNVCTDVSAYLNAVCAAGREIDKGNEGYPPTTLPGVAVSPTGGEALEWETCTGNSIIGVSLPDSKNPAYFYAWSQHQDDEEGQAKKNFLKSIIELCNWILVEELPFPKGIPDHLFWDLVGGCVGLEIPLKKLCLGCETNLDQLKKALKKGLPGPEEIFEDGGDSMEVDLPVLEVDGERLVVIIEPTIIYDRNGEPSNDPSGQVVVAAVPVGDFTSGYKGFPHPLLAPKWVAYPFGGYDVVEDSRSGLADRTEYAFGRFLSFSHLRCRSWEENVRAFVKEDASEDAELVVQVNDIGYSVRDVRIFWGVSPTGFTCIHFMLEETIMVRPPIFGVSLDQVGYRFIEGHLPETMYNPSHSSDGSWYWDKLGV